MTVDSGVTVTVGGYFQASSIVDNGTIAVANGLNLSLNGALTGGGQVQIGANAQLYVENAVAPASAVAIDFAGSGGLLNINSASLDSSARLLAGHRGLRFEQRHRLRRHGDQRFVLRQHPDAPRRRRDRRDA